VSASCDSDADCGDGLLCTSYVAIPGCGGTAFACQTEDDECATNADCTDFDECTFDGSRHVCQAASCAIGRPFLVEGAERVAPVVSSTSWLLDDAAFASVAADLAMERRHELARAWGRVGQMEHASIAAFSRFALQLLALGAPPELVEATQRAIADETAHAKLAFTLASAYAGTPMGPGLLGTEDALAETELRDIVLTAVREGCIGETVAAIEALESAEQCQDVFVAQVLRRIADDERRHAQLAWQFVEWALCQGDGTLLDAVRAEFQSARAEAEAEPTCGYGERDLELLAHGVFSDGLRRGLRHRVLASVIGPSAEQLFARVAPGLSRAA
jgi:hypothetical protein